MAANTAAPQPTSKAIATLAATLHAAGPLAVHAFIAEAAADGLAVAARRYAPLQPETLATVLSIAVRGR